MSGRWWSANAVQRNIVRVLQHEENGTRTLAQMDRSDLYIDYLCRTCMIKLEALTSEGSTEPQHQSIFETIEECDELRIADLLSSTIPQIVEVQLSDELPKKICCKCLHQLMILYRFQKLCVQSDHKMREMVSKKWDDLNMSMMEAAIEDEVLPNDTYSYPLSSCQPKCTPRNSLLPETETALEGRQQAIESESAQWSTAEHLPKNQLVDVCENSQGELNEFIKNDPIEGEENTEYSDTIQAQGELSEFIKNEPIEDDEENTEYSHTIHSTTSVTKEEFTTEEQKVTVPYKNIRDKNYQYPCDVCGKHFKTTWELNRHKLFHSGEKPHKCDFCEKRFVQAAALSQHMRTHTGEKPYKCKYCERCFPTKRALNTHLRVHHLGDNIHRCKFCPLAFRYASELRLHSITHKDEDPETRERNMAALREEEAKLKVNRYKNIRERNYQFQCDVCGKHSKRKSDLIKHKRSHSGEKPYKCDICEMRFIQSQNLSHHMRTHTCEKPCKCKYCDRCFTTKKLLNGHLRVHLGDNIHRCESCPLAFRLASELRLHSPTHKDEDPETRERNMTALREEEAKLKVNRYKNIRKKTYQYLCDVCGKHFKKPSDLKIHKRIHSGEKPHKCDFCEKRFIQAQNLSHHMRTHTGEKPYKCKYCDQCFMTTSSLNGHLGVHLGDNIHRCKFCPLAFRYASELRLHSITHKDEDPETRERNMAALREEEAKLKVNRYKNIRDKKGQYQYPCDVCGKHFKTTRDINRHKRIHSGEKPHKCDYCEKRFIQSTALRHHMRTHTGEKPCKCKYCDLCFTTRKIMNTHLRIHLGDKVYQCEFCPLAFRLASELRLHSFTHTHEDPETRERNMAALREEEAKLKVNRYKNIRDKKNQYPCDICGKHFKTTWELNRHKLCHSGEKPHKCDFCEKQFIQASDLNQHMRTHTGEKPYKCKYCKRCFATTSGMNTHLRVNHLGGNIHRCESCPLAFRLASELRLHSTTHKDEDPETRERNMAALRSHILFSVRPKLSLFGLLSVAIAWGVLLSLGGHSRSAATRSTGSLSAMLVGKSVLHPGTSSLLQPGPSHTCNTKIDRTKVAKVACVDCGGFFHVSCAKVTAADLDFMKLNNIKHRCEPCIVLRRKSLHQQPLPGAASGLCSGDIADASAASVSSGATTKSATTALSKPKITTNSSQKQQTHKIPSNNRDNIRASASERSNVVNNNNTNAYETESIQLSQQIHIDGDINTKEITLQLLYDEIVSLKKVNTEFLSTVKQLKEENHKLSERVSRLESVLNWREQQLLSSAVDIIGVPALTSDNANECTKQILGAALNLSVSPEEISKCYIKKFKQTNVLRIHFASTELKSKVMSQKRREKGKLTSQLFGDGQKSTNRALLTVAKKTKKAQNYKYLWINHGRIMMKKTDNSDVVILSTFDDLSKVTLHAIPVQIFVEEFSNLLRSENSANIVILGDFNLDILNANPTIDSFLNLVAGHGLTSYLNEPTRSMSGSCLDHVFCRVSNHFLSSLRSLNLDVGITDHTMSGVLLSKACAKNNNKKWFICGVLLIFTEPSRFAQMDTSDLYIDYLCRTCMIKLKAFRTEGSNEPQHQSIFETIEECDELRITDLLSSTIPQIVEVQLSDELPKKICCKCLHQLISVYRFQKLCVQSDHKMREMVSKKWDDLNMSMMEAAIEDEVLPNDTDSYPLSSCQPKCTRQNSLLPETETALEGRQQAIESESAQWSTAEHLLKNELLDFCENSQGELNEFIKNDPIEDEENTEYSDTIQAQGELSEFIKNEPIEDDEENTEYSHTIHSTTSVTKEEFTTEEQKVTVPYKSISDKKEQYQYPCDVCGKHFQTTRYLKRHKRIHSGEKPHKCDFCEMRFIQASDLNQHMRTHTGEQPYKCKYCERCFATKGVLNEHLRVHHLGDNIHRCKFCPLAFRLASELRFHSTTHKDEDPETRERNMAALREEEAKLEVNRYKNIRDKNEQYQYPCDMCGKHFKTKSVLNRHKRSHSGEKRHKCDICEMRFIQAQNLSHHMRTHTGEKPCKCKYCDRCFTTKNLLNEHLRVHLGDNIHRCESCPLAFRLVSELRLHSPTHKDEDPETRERNMAALREEEDRLKVNRYKNIRVKNYQYPCDVCGKHFKTKWNLKIHKGIHSDEKPYKCDFCEKRFIQAKNLSHHMRTHTGEQPYKCKYCDRYFTTTTALNGHLGVHLGDNIHRCKFCPLAFRYASELRLHSITHKDEDPETRERNMAALREEEDKLKVNRYKNIRDKNEQYQYPCDICGKNFKTKSILNRHKLYHSGEKAHKCDFCEKRFAQAVALSQHMRTHTGEKPYKCKYCERCFPTKSALNTHLRVHHLGDNIHRCKFCPLAFRLASELRFHSTAHKDEDSETRERNMAALMEEEAKFKVNRCDICGKRFNTKLLLKRHKRIHNDEKPHKCDFCEKRFAQAEHLRQHMRTHTGEKPYKCKYCDRCFTTKKLLHKHLRIHMGDNTYRCKFCPSAFRVASELRLHSTTHKDEDPETRERNMKALMEIEAKLKQQAVKRKVLT
ncbi:uncharacterized protein [Eurosta solidaginis]|uniref:uncharacterized protein n=1 Tax=Eurosta solidaginis TaxID=178769 RepID=UPI003530EE89